MAQPQHRQRGMRSACTLCAHALVIALGVLATIDRAVAAGDELIGAASREHLWLVLDPPKPDQPYALVQRASADPAWQYREQHTMNQSPAAMAAWGDQLWIVQQARAFGGIAASAPSTTAPATTAGSGERSWQREVYSAQVVLNQATGLYYMQPTGRLEMNPPLPGLGQLAGFVGTPLGPVALLMPSQRASVTVSAGENSIAAEPFLDRPMLLRLEPGKTSWTEIALPPKFNASREARLAAAGPDARELVLLTTSADNPEQADRFALRPDGSWLHTVTPLDLRRVRSLVSVAGQVAAVIDMPGDEHAIVYVRQTGTLPLTSLPRVSGRWMVAAMGDGLVLIERERSGTGPALAVCRIDPITGELGRAEPFAAQPLTAGRLWQMTLMIGLSLAAVLLVVMLRPTPASAIPIDARVVLPAGWRLLGGVVDFVVAAVPTTLLLGVSMKQLLVLPVMTLDLSRCGPYLLAAAMSTVIAMIGEVLAGRSLGKALVGGQLVAIDGTRPAAWRIVVRALVRFVVFALPPLAVFALTNSHMQGLPDWAGRTLVVQSDWQQQPPPPGELNEPE